MDEETLSSPKDLHINLPGLIRPEFTSDNRQEAEKVTSHTQFEYTNTKEDKDNPIIKVKDARAYQDITEESASSLFNQKGFCLFPQISKVKHWNEDYIIKGMICGSDITSIYAPELEGIIRNHLLAQYNMIVHRQYCEEDQDRRIISMEVEFIKTLELLWRITRII